MDEDAILEVNKAAQVPEQQLLPTEVVQHILQYVPAHQRLTRCARVCREWAAAATRLTDSIVLSSKQRIRLSSLQPWLLQHADQLTTLHLDQERYRPATLHLHCAKLTKLQSLRLNTLNVNLLPAAAAGSAFDDSNSTEASGNADAGSHQPLLPALQQLELRRCELETLNGLLQLAQSTALTSLQVQYLDIADFKGSANHHKLDVGMARVLEQLPLLHTLEINGFSLRLKSIRSVAAMQNLQDLTLYLYAAAPDMGGPGSLPHGLTRLVLTPMMSQPPQDILYPPCLVSLQDTLQMQELYLEHCCVNPAVLGRLTRLQSLGLQDCSLLQQQDAQQEQAQEQQGQEGQAQADAHDSAEVRTPLKSIAKLSQLQALMLALKGWGVEDTHPQLFSALTASRQLTSLQIECDNEQPLPRGAVQHMFPIDSPTLQLQVLNIACEDGDDGDVDVSADGWCLDGTDLWRIVAACPLLRCFGCLRVVDPSASLKALLQLPCCLQRLFVGGMAFGDAAAATVAQLQDLPSLEYLSWEHSPGLSDVGLQQLTALTGVTELLVMHCRGLSADIFKDCEDEYEDTVDLHSSYEKGPVWQQLQAMCINSPACAALGAGDSDVDMSDYSSGVPDSSDMSE